MPPKSNEKSNRDSQSCQSATDTAHHSLLASQRENNNSHGPAKHEPEEVLELGGGGNVRGDIRAQLRNVDYAFSHGSESQHGDQARPGTRAMNQQLQEYSEYIAGFTRYRPRASTNDSLRAQQGSPLLAPDSAELANIQHISLNDTHNQSGEGELPSNRAQIQDIPEECEPEDTVMDDA